MVNQRITSASLKVPELRAPGLFVYQPINLSVPYQVLGHTADIRLWAEGKNMSELFEAALLGAMAILEPEASTPREETVRHIEIDSTDPTALLIDFLNEALFNTQKYGEFYTGAEFENISYSHLRAKLKGKKADFFHEDIKAATYHEAHIEKNEAGNLETVVVFDI